MKFLVLFTGERLPQDVLEAVAAPWDDWKAANSEAMVDTGLTFNAAKAIKGPEVSDHEVDTFVNGYGYMIVQADDLDSAVALMQSSPAGQAPDGTMTIIQMGQWVEK